jgi:hypothetical protein
MPAQHLRRVNLIERQRDQSESAAVSSARSSTAAGTYLLFVAAVDPPPAHLLANPSRHPASKPSSAAVLCDNGRASPPLLLHDWSQFRCKVRSLLRPYSTHPIRVHAVDVRPRLLSQASDLREVVDETPSLIGGSQVGVGNAEGPDPL